MRVELIFFLVMGLLGWANGYEGVEIAVNGLPGVRRPVGDPAPWHVLIEVAWTFAEGLRGQVDAMLEH